MIKRKAKILIGALELLEEGGISNVTTKKMAMQQGVSEPALYRQYKSKLEIVEGIINEYASFDQQIMNTITDSEMKGKEALIFYVKRFAELYRNYSEITTVMFSMDVYFYNTSTKTMMKVIQKKRFDFLEELILEGQRTSDVSHQYNPKVMASMIDGLIFSQVYQWRMADKGYSFDEQLIAMIQQFI